jgi:predicted SAM-dependent methyltransferase
MKLAVLNSALSKLGVTLKRQPRSENELPSYRKRFGDKAVAAQAFYNIGSGSFRHAAWTNVDHPSQWYSGAQQNNVSIAWDIAALLPISVESGTAEIVYTSHTIEHLQDAHVRHLFNEAYRILKVGGFLRVSCPDIRIYFEGYRRREPSLLHFPEFYPEYSFQDHLLTEFAGQLSMRMKNRNPQAASSIVISDEEVDRVFATMPLEAACNHFTQMCDFDLQRKLPGAHINWWHFEKIEAFLKRAGFQRVRRSGYGQSFCAILANTHYFDNTLSRFSVYAETEK